MITQLVDYSFIDIIDNDLPIYKLFLSKTYECIRNAVLIIHKCLVLSSELQSVLKMMLAPEPSARATVLQLLTLPAVRRQRLKRQVSLFLLESLLFFFSFCQVKPPQFNPNNLLTNISHFFIW